MRIKMTKPQWNEWRTVNVHGIPVKIRFANRRKTKIIVENADNYELRDRDARDMFGAGWQVVSRVAKGTYSVIVMAGLLVGMIAFGIGVASGTTELMLTALFIAGGGVLADITCPGDTTPFFYFQTFRELAVERENTMVAFMVSAVISTLFGAMLFFLCLLFTYPFQ